MGLKENLLNKYDKHYKKFIIFSLALLLISFAIIGHSYISTGEIIEKGVSLKGGLTITLPVSEQLNIDDLEASLSAQFPDQEIIVRGLTDAGQLRNLIIESTENNENKIINAVNNYGLNTEEYTAEFIGSSLGEDFFKQTIIAIIIAFIFMGIVVFITFRKITPSLFVILAAFSDIISTIAVVSLFDIRLSSAGIAAFLMLIGYSVDTDILLTTRVLKSKEGSIFDRIKTALPTGLLMSTTSFAAVLVAYFFTQSAVIKQIMLILAIGLVFDMIYTWCQNAVILRHTLEKKYKKQRERQE